MASCPGWDFLRLADDFLLLVRLTDGFLLLMCLTGNLLPDWDFVCLPGDFLQLVGTGAPRWAALQMKIDAP